MKETPLFKLSYPEATDKPDGATQIKEAVEDVEQLLSTIELLLGTVPAPAKPEAGQLIIVNGTSDPRYIAATGDVTNNSAGVFSIGEGKVLEGMLGGEVVASAKIKALAVTAAKLAAEAVETAKIKNLHVTEGKLANLAVTAGKLAAEAVETGKIQAGAVTEAKLAAEAVTTGKIANLAVTEGKVADGAVSSRKFKPTVGLVQATANLALGAAYADIAGTTLEITPAVESYLKVKAIFHLEVHPNADASNSEGTINLDGADQAGTADLYGNAAAVNIQHRATVMQEYLLTLTAAKHTIKMRAKKTEGKEACNCFAANTRYLYELVAK